MKEAAFNSKTDHLVRLKFYANTYDASINDDKLQIDLQLGHNVSVEGLATPLWSTIGVENAFHNAYPIGDVKSLPEIASQRTFTLEMPVGVIDRLHHVQLQTSRLEYDKFGNEHDWEIEKYERQLLPSKSCMAEKLPKSTRFDTPNDCQVSMIQGALQDV